MPAATISARKLAANRANARKFTGPRTARGKRRSSMNGLIHGFFAQNLVLKGENARQFERFRATMLLDLDPQRPLELMLAERVVSASWRLRRLQTIESVTHHTSSGMYLARAMMDDECEVDSEQDDAVDLDANLIDGESAIDPQRLRQQRRRQQQQQQRFTARALRYPSISTIARGLAEGGDLLERLSRYEQRLEMSIHRSLRQLEKLQRRRSHDPTDDELAEPTFPPDVADQPPVKRPRKSRRIQPSEPTAKTAARNPERKTKNQPRSTPSSPSRATHPPRKSTASRTAPSPIFSDDDAREESHCSTAESDDNPVLPASRATGTNNARDASKRFRRNTFTDNNGAHA